MTTSTIDRPACRVLSDEQLAFFAEEGYLVVKDLFTDRDLDPVIAEITEAIDRLSREFIRAGELSRSYAELDFGHRLAAINSETPNLASRLWNVGTVLPSFFELMRTPRLLDAVEQICGPEIIASSVYRLRPKVPGHKQSAVPWHQDSGYFEAYCDDAMVLTVWLPLVDATEENGCLWVLPRQHKGKVLLHQRPAGQPYLEIPSEALPAGQAICCPVPKGGALLLSNRTPHASFDNRTDRVRWSMDLRYQSAALPTNASISRLPGEVGYDGTQTDAPIACYPPEPDFLVRSRARPREVMTRREEFLKLRREHVARPVKSRWAIAPKA